MISKQKKVKNLLHKMVTLTHDETWDPAWNTITIKNAEPKIAFVVSVDEIKNKSKVLKDVFEYTLLCDSKIIKGTSKNSKFILIDNTWYTIKLL